jgi:UDP-2,3-diacylglucosamine pyrophosphatase LpxH
MMKKNIYIGDIHGRNCWKQIVEQHPNADNIVFVGDYFDSFDISGIEQLFNVEEIIRFKQQQELDPSKKVYLLIGNHDLHYWPGIKWRGTTSGFQAKMLHQFEYFFRENEKMFQMAVKIGNNLCTHAGVSSVFLKDTGYWSYDTHNDESHVVEFLNDLFHHKPNEFDFGACQDRYYGLMVLDSYGNDEGQSSVWIRPKSLQKSNKNSDLKHMYVQIVGHTQQEKIDIGGKSTGGRYFYIDTLPSGEYLIEENNEFKVGKLWEK